jgi:Ni/Co efflux regulator RcnB
MLGSKGIPQTTTDPAGRIAGRPRDRPAFADQGGHHDRGHDDDHHHATIDRHDDDHRGCPPGLAKKHNGCLPPGQAKKLDRHGLVGHHVPPNAVYVVPRHVRTTLPPPPVGYRYAVVNNQVVLVSGGNIVVDIVVNVIG